MRDDWDRSCLAELQLEFPYLKTMHPVGRLDADTSGLLLFSSNGDLTQILLHPSSGVTREYEALVVGRVNASMLGPVLSAGVKTTEGTFAALLLDARDSGELVPLKDVVPPRDSLVTTDSKGECVGELVPLKDAVPPRDSLVTTDSNGECFVATSAVRVSVTEGKYRMVRRVLHNAGHSVVRLHRVRYGGLLLGELDEGEVRAASQEEEQWARGVLAARR